MTSFFRETIKLPSSEQDLGSIEDPHRLWNLHLIENLLPICLLRLMRAASSLPLENRVSPLGVGGIRNIRCQAHTKLCLQYHDIYPCESDLLDQWKLLHHNFVSHLSEEDIFFTENGGGKLIRAEEGVFRAESTVETDDLDDIKDAILLQGGLNLVKVRMFGVVNHGHCMTLLRLELEKVRPDMLEDLASTIGVAVADNKTVSDALRSMGGETGLNASKKLLLAEEFLNDDAYSHFELMAGLQILPSLAGVADNAQIS